MLARQSEAVDIRKLVEQFAGLPGALLPLLHAIQARFRHIPPSTVATVAAGLNLSQAEVHGVISFYHDFNTHPPGQHIVQICCSEACQAMGSRDLEQYAQATLEIGFGETTADGHITLQPVYCLGNCACSPSVQINGKVHARVDAGRFDELIGELNDCVHVPARSQVSEQATTCFYLPQDTTAVALGADAVGQQLVEEYADRQADFSLLRTGSRGLFFLEPLLEVDTDQGRIAFGPVTDSDIASILTALEGDPSGHSLYQGDIEKTDYLAHQQRITFARAGIGDPICLDNYKSLNGFKGLHQALLLTAQGIVDQVKQSGLRGRGGAAFPAGIKWQTVLDAPGKQKYIVCNADEGDSGTFADRLLMEADPYQLIEGMIIAGLAVGATQGYIYLRSEYGLAFELLGKAIEHAVAAGFLGNDIMASGRDFHLQLRLGAGAYICGEETALLDSLEGKRGMVRVKPPLPALKGLFGKPTVVNNVLTLAAATTILDRGGEAYSDLGLDRSRGTLSVQLAGNIKRGGLIEVGFGLTLREILDNYGKGTLSGRPVRAIQVGGPLGAFLPESHWDTPMDYEAFAEIGAMVGHGGVVVFDDTVDMAAQARFAMEFCAVESCGKCTPCRIGSTRGVEVIDRIRANQNREDNLILLHDLCDTMEAGSLCAMGGLTPAPVRSALSHFSEDFRNHDLGEQGNA